MLFIFVFCCYLMEILVICGYLVDIKLVNLKQKNKQHKQHRFYRNIVKSKCCVCRSKEEGHYEQLEICCEQRILELNPNR